MAVIGIDLGATKLAGALFGTGGSIRERAGELLAGAAGDAVGRLIVEQVRGARAAARRGGKRWRPSASRSRASPHHEGGHGLGPQHRRVGAIPLADVLAAEVGPGCPVVVESDRACSILGEVARGAARGCRHAVFLAVGTGIGAGILVDGAILRGAARHRRRDRVDGPRPALPRGL